MRLNTSNICKYSIFIFIHFNGNLTYIRFRFVVNASNKKLLEKYVTVVFSTSTGKFSRVMELLGQH